MKRERGRPPLKERRPEPISIRLSKKLRSQLDAVRRTAEGERSLSHEIELRLQQSFELDSKIKERFGGHATYWILQIIANAIASIERSCSIEHPAGLPPEMVALGFDPKNNDVGRRWYNDRYVFDQVMMMIDVIFDRFKPTSKRTIPRPMQGWHPSLKNDVENFGRHIALLELAAFATARDLPREQQDESYERWMPIEFRAARFPLGGKLKGSPVKELLKDRQATARRLKRSLTETRKQK